MVCLEAPQLLRRDFAVGGSADYRGASVAGLAMDAAKKILLENADNISGVNAYDQFLKDAGDSHDSEE